MKNRCIRLLQFSMVGSLVMAISVAGGPAWNTPAAAQESRMSSPALRDHELRTMSKVIEESLDESGLKDWKNITVGFSPFESLVRAQYIPTVGAIFTIPVSFPLIAPAPKPEKQEPEAAEEEPDLWEKHAGESFEPGPSLPDSVREKIVVKAPDQALQFLQQAELAQADLAFEGEAAYDEAKVQQLRQVLLETLARYGNRMEHVGDKERILLVAEHSPFGPMRSIADYIGVANYITKALRIGSSEVGDMPVRKHMEVVTPRKGAHAQRQSYLIAVSKSDLSAETSFEKLEKKVEEIRY